MGILRYKYVSQVTTSYNNYHLMTTHPFTLPLLDLRSIVRAIHYMLDHTP